MKSKIIDTGKCTILLVEIPEGQMNVCIDDVIEKDSKWDFLCKASEITEEQARGIVAQSIHSGLYGSYVEGVSPVNVYCYKSSIKSYESMLRAESIYWENIHNCWKEGETTLEDWYEFQQKVWNKQRTHIFIKQD